MTPLEGRVLFEGSATGIAARLSAPISFWGGVDPVSGTIADPRHPDHGKIITGSVLSIPETVGSSSSSAILLELLRLNTAPAALLLGSCDAILVLGVLVARELGYPTIPVVEIEQNMLGRIPNNVVVSVARNGQISWKK